MDDAGNHVGFSPSTPKKRQKNRYLEVKCPGGKLPIESHALPAHIAG
jgi:hypothetical protein